MAEEVNLGITIKTMIMIKARIEEGTETTTNRLEPETKAAIHLRTDKKREKAT